MVADSSHVATTATAATSAPEMEPEQIFGADQVADASMRARSTAEVTLPLGQSRVVVPVAAGQTISLPPSEGALYAKLGAEGNLAIVLDGRTIILSGYVSANEQAPVHIVGAGGQEIDIVEVLAATDPSLDIATAAGPAAGPQGDSGSGVYTPFVSGPGLGGLDAAGVLDATALRYRLIDDERRYYPLDEDKANGLPSGGETAAVVDDEGLPQGNAGGTGDVPGEQKSASGTLPGGFGPDGAGNFSFAALDGTQAMLGTETADLSWDNASHTLTGAGSRGDLFEITVDPATGAYTFTLLDNVLHAPGEDENDASITLGYTVTDGNGDSAPGSILITIDDDTPIASVTPTDASVTHDETAGAQGDSEDVTTQPAVFAALESNNGLDAIGWAASSGAVVSAGGSAMGADGTGTPPSYALTIPSAGVDSGVDTTDGQSIFLFQEGDLVVGRVGASDAPDAGGAIAFAVSIDPASGVVSVGQYLSLEHPTGGASHDEAIALADGAIQALVTVTDGDGDVASGTANIGKSIGFEDDGPTAAISLTGVDVTHDESWGRQSDADDAWLRPAIFAGFELTHHLNAIGWAASDGAVVSAAGSNTGADNEGATMAFSLGVPGAGVDSGVDTTDGQSIFLFQEGNLIIGRVGSGDSPNTGGAIAFAVSIDPASGVVSIGQYLSLEHPTGGASHDEAIALAASAIQALVTVTDGDGDVARQQVNIGGSIGFQDDGPRASICLTGLDVTHDESTGRQFDADDVTTRPSAFAGFEALHHLAAMGWAVSPGAVVTAWGSATGADNEGATGSFSLKIPGTGVNSGVDTTDGDSIFLFQEGNLIVGRVGSGAGGNSPDAHGDIAFAVSIDPASGVLSVGQYLSLEHPTGGNSHDEGISLATGAIQAIVTVIDGDGDVATDSVNIGKSVGFQDDGPRASICLTGVDVSHDESAGRQSDADDVSTRPAAFAGFELLHHLTAMGWAASPGAVVTAAASNTGADNEGATTAFSLKIPTNGVNSGVDTTDGKSIFLFQEGGLIVGRIGNGESPNAGGDVAFAVSIDAASGVLSIGQYVSLEHPVGGASYDETISLATGAIQAVVTVTDGDGDVSTDSVNIGKSVGFQDDGPCASICLTGVDVSHDESAGRQSDADDVSTRPAAFAGLEAVNHLAAIGWAVSPGAVVTAVGSNTGADNEGATIGFALKIPFGIVDAGVDTTDGNSIWLFQDGNLIVGRVGSGPDGNFPNSDGAIAFAVSIDPATGVVSVGQYLSLEHPAGGSSHDEAIALANGAIQAIVTVTDGDGDVATDSVNIGRTVSFQDDGPCASICLTGIDVSHDESAGRQSDADDVSTRPAAFASLEAVNHLAALGWAVSPGAVVTANAATGADNEGATAAFALKIAGAGTDSGVDTTDGRSIFLFEEGGLIVGRVGSGLGGLYPDTHGAIAFAVSIDAASGLVSVGQYLSLENPIGGGSYDESIALASGAIQAVVTVTDGDGDVATDSVNIGGKIAFQDDGPCAFDPQDWALSNKAGSHISGDLDIGGHTGVDGFGAIGFANITDGQVALGSVAGVTKTLKFGGETIYLFTSADDTVLTGTTDPTGADAGKAVFTLALNGSGDNYVFNLIHPIDNGAGLSFNYFGNAGAGSNRWVGIFTDSNAPSGGDPNHEDLLLTPINGKYVNTSATDIGLDNQHINAGEGVRIDFVTDVNGNQKSDGAFSYSGHFLVTDASFKVVQVQGSSSSDAVVRVRAYNADNDNTMSGDKGDVAVALTLNGLVVRNAAGAIVPLGSGGVQAYTIGGDIVVDGLKEGYTVEVKSATPYDRLEITNADGLDIDGDRCDPDLDGKAFEISTVAVIQAADGNDIGLHYDTVLRDGDGDTVSSPDGIDLALLAGANAVPTSYDATDTAGLSDQDSLALSADRDGTDQDGGAPMLFAAASIAGEEPAHSAAQFGADDDGNPVAGGTGGDEAQDGWNAAALDYDAIAAQPAPDGGSSDALGQDPHAITVTEVLDGADASASAGADTDSDGGTLALDDAAGSPASDYTTPDAADLTPDTGDNTPPAESLGDLALGDLVAYIVPNISDQIATDEVPPAL